MSPGDQYDINDIPRGDGVTEETPSVAPESEAPAEETPAEEEAQAELTPPTPPDGPTAEGA